MPREVSQLIAPTRCSSYILRLNQWPPYRGDLGLLPTLCRLLKTWNKFVSSLERYFRSPHKTASDNKAGWGLLSLVWMMTSGMQYRPKSHHWIILLLEFINWGLFLAVWIILAIEVSL